MPSIARTSHIASSMLLRTGVYRGSCFTTPSESAFTGVRPAIRIRCRSPLTADDLVDETEVSFRVLSARRARPACRSISGCTIAACVRSNHMVHVREGVPRHRFGVSARLRLPGQRKGPQIALGAFSA